MQVIVRHPHLTDAISAGVAVCRAATDRGDAPLTDRDEWESDVVAQWRQIIAAVPDTQVGLACYGRRVVGYAATAPTAQFGVQTEFRPVRETELRFFGVLADYSSTALLQRLIDFVMPTIIPVQAWLPESDSDTRAFLRTQGLAFDGAVATVNGVKMRRVVR